MSIPLIRRTRSLWPSSYLTLVCRQGIGDFFLKMKLVDKVIEVKKGDSNSYQAAKNELNSKPIDLVIAPHTSLRTTYFCMSLRATEKITFKKKWNFWIFDKRVQWPRALPEALRQLYLLTRYDTDLLNKMNSYSQNSQSWQKNSDNRLSAVPEWASMSLRAELNSTNYNKEWQSIPIEARQMLESKSTIMIFPGSVWATKKWPASGYLQLAKGLVQQGYHILWMGGSGEEALAADLAQRLPGSVSLAGQTSVLQSCLMMTKCRLVVCNDSASSHMAAASQTPVISIFGPTVLEFGYRPWTSEAYIIEREGLACRPCGKHGSAECPIKTHICMTDLGSEEVLKQTEITLRYNP